MYPMCNFTNFTNDKYSTIEFIDFRLLPHELITVLWMFKLKLVCIHLVRFTVIHTHSDIHIQIHIYTH